MQVAVAAVAVKQFPWMTARAEAAANRLILESLSHLLSETLPVTGPILSRAGEVTKQLARSEIVQDRAEITRDEELEEEVAKEEEEEEGGGEARLKQGEVERDGAEGAGDGAEVTVEVEVHV